MTAQKLISSNGCFSLPLDKTTGEPLSSFDGGKTINKNFYTLSNEDKGQSLFFLSDEAIAVYCPDDLQHGFFCSLVQAGSGRITVDGNKDNFVAFNDKFSTIGINSIIGFTKMADGKFMLTGNLGD
jgi:hypothetical protein